jgi:hypothetical protein
MPLMVGKSVSETLSIYGALDMNLGPPTYKMTQNVIYRIKKIK